MIVRPFRVHEAWWAAGGAIALMLAGAISPPAAVRAIGRGTDVYLFLAGMMALAAYANVAGVFAWVAALAVRIAGASRLRLFVLIYVPAVIDALRRYDASPRPYVIACALIANAASFVLPISNPSNLLVFAGRMPPLGRWLGPFALPSAAAIAVTFAVAWWLFRSELRGQAADVDRQPVAAPARTAVMLLIGAAAIVVTTSALGGMLGIATSACALVTTVVAALGDRAAGMRIAREISWPIIVLTGALFVLVTAVDDGGGFVASRSALAWCAHQSAPWSAIATGFLVAATSNVVNNLPVGLNLGEVLPSMHASLQLGEAALIGVNLGPNATVNGSLATLLWLAIVRRAGIAISPLAFLRIGSLAAALLFLSREIR